MTYKSSTFNQVHVAMGKDRAGNGWDADRQDPDTTA